jgi:hypothetical protein
MRFAVKLARLSCILPAALAFIALSPSVASAACEDFNGSYFARWLEPDSNHEINVLTYLPSMDKAKVTLRLEDAADTWNREITDCGGWTPKPLHHMTVAPGAFTSAQQRPNGDQGKDNRSLVAFGPIAGPQWGVCNAPGSTLACTETFRGPLGEIIEADTQFDTQWSWWGGRETGPGNANDHFVPDGWFDLWGVAAHEFGHAVGLNHTPSAGEDLTMRPQFCSGSNEAVGQSCNSTGGSSANARTLGAGDMHWYEANYTRTTT